MSFKKQVNSKANIVIAGGDESKLFPVKFKYRIGDNLYEVFKVFNDGDMNIRRVVGTDGSVDDMSVKSIIRDLTEQPGGIETEILDDQQTDEKIDEDGNKEPKEQ